MLDHTVDIGSNSRYNTHMTNTNTNTNGETMTDIQKCEMIARVVVDEQIESAFVRDLLIQKLLKANDLVPTNQVITFVENLIENAR